MFRDSRSDRRWRLALLALATVVLFLLLHPYRGLVHDSRLYTIQALSHLYPELYASDIFVALGSQDDYTLFSPLFAWTISWLGVEPAAAMVTIGAMVLFLAGAWALARTFLSAEQSAIAVLLLLLIPAHYGPSRIFHYLEEFATPRQLSEALALFCIVAWLRGQRLVASACACTALLVHPIVGAVGVAFVPVFEWITSHWRKLWPVCIVSVALIGIAMAGWLPLSRWQFDQEWYGIVMSRTYLGLRNWSSEDWSRIAAVLATLAIAGIALRERLQRVATATLITCSFLLLVAAIGGDVLRLVIVVQTQPWRVLWLATVVAIVLLPPLYASSWRGTALAHCSLLLLAAAWISPQGIVALVCAPLAVAAVAFSSRSVAERHAKLFLWGSRVALGMALMHAMGTALLTWNEDLTTLETLPPVLDKVLSLGYAGVVPALAALLAAFLVLRFPSTRVRLGFAALGTGAVALLASPYLSTWTTMRYTEDLRAAFQSWRDLIPPNSNVLWTSEEVMFGDGAVNTWLLLERPSFISGTQAPNALFSRAAALEMKSRTTRLWGLVPFTDPFRPKGDNTSVPTGPLQLAPLCRTSTVQYVVTQATMVDATPIPAPTSAPLFLRDYKLYTCT